MKEEFDDDIFRDPELKTKAMKKVYEDSRANKKTFSELLQNLEMDAKVKALWQQVYENAVEDRMKAQIAWTDLYSSMHNQPNEHFKNGQILAKYMERMEKANAQLLKLTELVQNVIKETGSEDEEDNIPLSDEIYAKSESRFKQK